MPLKVDRNTLYTDVWATPMYQLTDKYGLSAERLKKSCRELQVPLPDRSYWAKKRLGLKVPVAPLPSLDTLGNAEEPDPFRSDPLPGPFNAEVKAVMARYEGAEREARKLKSQFEWERRHPGKRYSAADRVYGSWEHFRDDGLVLCATQKRSVLQVSVGTWRRAIPILQSLMNRLEAAGYKVSMPKDEGRVVADRLSVTITIRGGEKIDQAVVMKQKSYDSEPRAYKVRTPTGRLFIAVEAGTKEARVNDGLEQKVEDQWDLVMAAVARQHKVAVDADAERERWRREFQAQRQAEAEEERKREEVERLAAEEKRSRDDLLREAQAWQSAALIRAYVLELSEHRDENGEPSSGFEEWKAWALKVAGDLDPSDGRGSRKRDGF